MSYDELYRGGGYGYEEQRATLSEQTRERFIVPFGLRPGETLLDVGCGDGFWTSVFADHGFTATGVDLSAVGIEVARERYPQAEFHVRNVEQPLFADGRRFDVVFCRALSHFCRKPLLNPATMKAMRNMAACVAKGGLFVMSYWTLRNRADQRDCADHMVSDLMMLVEPWLDPIRMTLERDDVNIAAQRRDAPRGR